MIWAVLTGDMVESSGARPETLDASIGIVAETAERMAHWPGRVWFGRHRGDGWQIALSEGALGLRAAMLVIAGLRRRPQALRTRVSLAIGPVDRIGRDDLSDAHGAAFTASGQALDAMGRGDRFRLSGPAVGPRDAVIGDLMHEIARRWSQEQAMAAVEALDLDPPTNIELARRLEISPQGTSARLANGGIQILRAALRDWEAAMAGETS